MAKDDKKKGKKSDLVLKEEQVEKFKNWIDSKKQGPMRCPVCEATEWDPGDLILAPPAVHPTKGGVSIGGPSYPIIPVTCMNCGYTRMFNAFLSGVLSPQKKDEGGDNGK